MSPEPRTGFDPDEREPWDEAGAGLALVSATDGRRKVKGPEDSFDDVPDEPGHVLLEDVAAWLRAHVAYSSEHHAPVIALWAMHTHALDCAYSTPRLVFTSPEPESGKTRNLELLEPLVHEGVMALQISASSLFRIVEAKRPSILMDEVDAVFNPKSAKDHEDLRALVNAGHRPGAKVLRVETPSMKVKEFRCYSPVALAGLGALPLTIRSRAITITMRRRAPDEYVAPFEEDITRPEGEALGRRLAAWVSRHHHEVGRRPTLPGGVSDRPADCWKPLVALADAAGGDWPEKARSACVALVGMARGDDELSLGIRLLSDIRAVFDGSDKLSTASILEKLTALELSPWADLHGKPINARWLAGKLKPYGATPRDVFIGGSSLKGYYAEDFHEAWARYTHMGDVSDKGDAPGSAIAPIAPIAHRSLEGLSTDADQSERDSVRLIRAGQRLCLDCGSPVAGSSYWCQDHVDVLNVGVTR